MSNSAAFLSMLAVILSGASIALSLRYLIQRYRHDRDARRRLGAPPVSFWHVFRGRGFWKDEVGQWHNE